MINCVAVVAINGETILNHTKPLLEQYCKRTNSDLVIICLKITIKFLD